MAWTDEMVNQLREMWKEGLTTGEIGKRLGVSKNSIVGKVHRLGLSGRPSPIKKKDTTDSTPANNNKTETKNNIVKEKAEPKVSKKITEEKEEKIEKAEPSVQTVEPIKNKHHHGKTMLTDLDNHTCRWPIGDPKDENFHFCGKKIRLGQTYCDEHANIAYVKAIKK